MKHRFLSILLTSVALLFAASAHAEDKQDKKACLDAVSKGQIERDSHNLVEAREQFRICARPQCPVMVQQDCGNWLAENERDMPTVVVTARASDGTELGDVRVSVDGQPLATNLNGQAVAINPGHRVFRFEAPDGAHLDRSMLVREGEKNQLVAAVLERPTTPQMPAPSVGVQRPSAGAASTKSRTPWRAAGWVAGGLGVVGLGVGTAFGIVAIGDKAAAHCDSGRCDPGSLGGPIATSRSAAHVADVGFVVGGTLLAGGAALVLFAPKAVDDARTVVTAVRVAPSLTTRGGGIVLVGGW